MKVEIKDGKLIIEIDCFPEPIQSKSGKTLMVASTRGNVQTDAEVDGKTVYLGVNAYIYPE